MKVAEGFWDAEILAKFANLNPSDSNAVDYFKNYYSEFAPLEWWNYPHRIEGNTVINLDSLVRKGIIPTIDQAPEHLKKLVKTKPAALTHLQWHHAQEQVRKAWKRQFAFPAAVKRARNVQSRKLGVTVSPPEVEDLADLLKLVFQADSGDRLWNSSQLLLPDGTIHEIKAPVPYAFHKAVLYLHQHRNQAKICELCGKYFVTAHGKRGFCEYKDERGETCRQKSDNERKLDYYYDTGKQVRQAKTKKGSPRLPGSRRKKAVVKPN